MLELTKGQFVPQKRNSTPAKPAPKRPRTPAAGSSGQANARPRTRWQFWFVLAAGLIIGAGSLYWLGPEPVASGCRGKTLAFNSAGSCVSNLQDWPLRMGLEYRQGRGSYNQETVAAVKRFQLHHGLPADGIVSEDTWSRICSLLRPARTTDSAWAAYYGCIRQGDGYM
ncbi:peptidoglycan-binding protein [Candidatus Saccharibacteria bacterium]|nr:peptidoglycan-binding protein [Candidatus Saccharibacteria bacterium]